ncbi:MAG: HIT family protein [archaeon]
MEDCIFCKIASGEISQSTIYEDDKSLAFLDIKPAGRKGAGHTLVIPKRHYKLITDIPDDELEAVIRTVKRVSKALLSFSAGVNVLQNNERPAGQFVMHAHFHVIPRSVGDGIEIEKWNPRDYAPGEMDGVSEKMKTLLNEE